MEPGHLTINLEKCPIRDYWCRMMQKKQISRKLSFRHLCLAPTLMGGGYKQASGGMGGIRQPL